MLHKSSSERVQVTRSFVGLICMQVCAVSDATDEEILEVCNRDNRCGTENGWMKVIRNPDGGLFEGPESAPVQCQEDKNRIHFLVSC